MMDGQLSLLDGDDELEEIPAEALFEPNGSRRCQHCRRRLHAFAGRLLCVNPHCTGGS